MVLLDTSIAINLHDRDQGTWQRVVEKADRPLLSLVTVIEPEGGAAGNSQTARGRRAALERLLPQVQVLPLDEAVVQSYRTIVRRLGFSRPRILDRLIAGTALVHDLRLITANGTDFADIPGLQLEVWPAPAQ